MSNAEKTVTSIGVVAFIIELAAITGLAGTARVVGDRPHHPGLPRASSAPCLGAYPGPRGAERRGGGEYVPIGQAGRPAESQANGMGPLAAARRRR